MPNFSWFKSLIPIIQISRWKKKSKNFAFRKNYTHRLVEKVRVWKSEKNLFHFYSLSMSLWLEATTWWVFQSQRFLENQMLWIDKKKALWVMKKWSHKTLERTLGIRFKFSNSESLHKQSSLPRHLFLWNEFAEHITSSSCTKGRKFRMYFVFCRCDKIVSDLHFVQILFSVIREL